MRKIFLLFAMLFVFAITSAQTIVYDKINKESGFRMIATSQELCPLPEENFWAMFYLAWGGNDNLGDYHLSIHYYSTTPCSIKQGDRLLLFLGNGTKVSLSSDYDTESEKSEDPFEADISFPYEIDCSFTITKLQIGTIINAGLKGIFLELAPKSVSASGYFTDFSKKLSTMLQLIDDKNK